MNIEPQQSGVCTRSSSVVERFQRFASCLLTVHYLGFDCRDLDEAERPFVKCHIRINDCPARLQIKPEEGNMVRINFVVVDHGSIPTVEVFMYTQRPGQRVNIIGSTWFFPEACKTVRKEFRLHHDERKWGSVGKLHLQVSTAVGTETIEEEKIPELFGAPSKFGSFVPS